MNGFICERCFETYDVEGLSEQFEPITIHITEKDLNLNSRKTIGCKFLCPKCMQGLKDTINNYLEVEG